MFLIIYNWNLKVRLTYTTIKKITTSILHHNAQMRQ